MTRWLNRTWGVYRAALSLPAVRIGLVLLPLLLRAATLSAQAVALEPKTVSKAEALGEITGEYIARHAQREAVSAQVKERFGKPFHAFTEKDYTTFMADLDFDRDNDLWTWSHVTGIPIVAVSQRKRFFHKNAHLLADTRRAALMSDAELDRIKTHQDRESGALSLQSADDEPLKMRPIPEATIMPLKRTSWTSHNKDFAEDRLVFEALGPYLVPWKELNSRKTLQKAVRTLPLSAVQVLRGKAIYFSTLPQGESGIVIRPDTDVKYTLFAGMQPGLFLARTADGATVGALVREVGRVIHRMVINRDYLGLYAYPYQFPEFQKLNARTRNLFGRLRSSLPQTAHGYINDRARTDSQENFVEHFRAYILEKEAFRKRAVEEQARGHPLLMEKYRFMENLLKRTPTTMYRLSWESFIQENPEKQREIMQEYITQTDRRDAVIEEVEKEFGKSVLAFTEKDYATFMKGLDLDRDEDLWKWSHVSGIPIVGLNRKSLIFQKNAHLLADTKGVQLLSPRDLGKVTCDYKKETGEFTIRLPDGTPGNVRELPKDIIIPTERTGGIQHNKDFVPDRIVFEVLEPYLARLGDLEVREEFAAGIRALPWVIVKALRGKALYPATWCRTGWAFTWRVNLDTNPSYAGMQPGAFVEPRRAAGPLGEILRNMNGSLGGSSIESLIHEVGHLVDHSVISPRSKSFPHQFPEFQALAAEKDRIFGSRSNKVPQTPYGYISNYAKTNAQESIAEHFWAYVRGKDVFRERAEQEAAEGHPELMEKYAFMERLFEKTPATMHMLSREYLQK